MNYDRYLDYSSPESDLTVTEQLYTARGSQGAGMQARSANRVAADPAVLEDTY